MGCLAKHGSKIIGLHFTATVDDEFRGAEDEDGNKWLLYYYMRASISIKYQEGEEVIRTTVVPQVQGERQWCYNKGP